MTASRAINCHVSRRCLRLQPKGAATGRMTRKDAFRKGTTGTDPVCRPVRDPLKTGLAIKDNISLRFDFRQAPCLTGQKIRNSLASGIRKVWNRVFREITEWSGRYENCDDRATTVPMLRGMIRRNHHRHGRNTGQFEYRPGRCINHRISKFVGCFWVL